MTHASISTTFALVFIFTACASAHSSAEADANIDTDLSSMSDAAIAREGLALARAAVDGPVDVEVTEVYVTYLKPEIEDERAGFFVQQERLGPALFIAIDPAGLSVGDLVSLRVAEMATIGGLRLATAIEDLEVHSSGTSTETLIQEVTDASDLVSALADFESELLSIDLTVIEDFTGAGAGYKAAVVASAAIGADPDLRLRIPADLQDAISLVPTCTTTISATPLWRIAGAAQVSAWELSELSAMCPAPRAITASADTTSEVRIEFDRAIDANSIVNATNQFSFDKGLVANTASVAGRVITLSTGPMIDGQSYSVTVASSVLDVLGGGVASPHNAVVFTGNAITESICDDGVDGDLDGFIDCHDKDCSGEPACSFAPQLYLWEVDADNASIDTVEFVEIWNNTGSTVDLENGGYYLVLVNGSGELSYAAVGLIGTMGPDSVFVAGSGDISLAANQVIGTSNILQNGADGVLLVRCATCSNAATDFPQGLAVGTNQSFTTATGKTAIKIDGLAYDTNDSDDPELIAVIGTGEQFDEAARNSAATDSNHRTSLGGWRALASGPGQAGTQP